MLLDNAAQIGQVLLAGRALLHGVRDGDAGDLDALGGAEKVSVTRPPGKGMADLLGLEMDIVHAGALERCGQFQADGPCANDGHLG